MRAVVEEVAPPIRALDLVPGTAANLSLGNRHRSFTNLCNNRTTRAKQQHQHQVGSKGPPIKHLTLYLGCRQPVPGQPAQESHPPLQQCTRWVNRHACYMGVYDNGPKASNMTGGQTTSATTLPVLIADAGTIDKQLKHCQQVVKGTNGHTRRGPTHLRLLYSHQERSSCCHQ